MPFTTVMNGRYSGPAAQMRQPGDGVPDGLFTGIRQQQLIPHMPLHFFQHHLHIGEDAIPVTMHTIDRAPGVIAFGAQDLRLTRVTRRRIYACWRAANYLSVGMFIWDQNAIGEVDTLSKFRNGLKIHRGYIMICRSGQEWTFARHARD
jgi:hypothetical protein